MHEVGSREGTPQAQVGEFHDALGSKESIKESKKLSKEATIRKYKQPMERMLLIALGNSRSDEVAVACALAITRRRQRHATLHSRYKDKGLRMFSYYDNSSTTLEVGEGVQLGAFAPESRLTKRKERLTAQGYYDIGLLCACVPYSSVTSHQGKGERSCRKLLSGLLQTLDETSRFTVRSSPSDTAL